MYSAFIDPDHITPAVSTIPALFAKSSMLWSTIFFIYTNKDLRKRFWGSFLSKKDFENKNYCEKLHEIQLTNTFDGKNFKITIENLKPIDKTTTSV